MGLGNARSWEDYQAKRERATACSELASLLQQFGWVYPDEADLIGDEDEEDDSV